ncbi:hypothetical protein JW948_11030 [bacterium]|nr:hypothetical protein [bacterium]
MKFKSILLKFIVYAIAVISVIVIILSTTGFQVQKNAMEHFFSQHTKIDSSLFDVRLSREDIVYDIDYLIQTIEAVHPAPYSSISKEKFYLFADSLKNAVSGLTREDLFNALVPLVKSLEDGHTQIKFPEISSGQDNKAIFDQAHQNTSELISYQNLQHGIGYLVVGDFASDRTFFTAEIDTAFKTIRTDSIRNLIIDIRNNPGGGSELADVLVSHIYDKPYRYSSIIQIKRSDQYYEYMKRYFSWWLRPFLGFIKTFRDYRQTTVGAIYVDVKGVKQPVITDCRFDGNKFLLINGHTGSTALGFATVFKDYGIGTVIGEQTKAAVNGFGDIYAFDLPRSGLWVWCSTKRYIRPSGEYTAGGLRPDITIPDTDDAIMVHTLNLIKNRELL